MNIDLVESATAQFLAADMRVMNAFLLADTESAHVAKLLELMQPPQGACILDAGCGVGAVAEMMRDARPDLSFKLLNLSPLQLSLCPEGMERIEADFNNIPLADQSVDVVMFNFAICHSQEWLPTLVEARRTLREGGVLFVYDMVRESGNNAIMGEVLQAAAFSSWMVEDTARRAGFVLTEGVVHEPAVERLKEVMGPTFQMVCGGVKPATWRFVRQTVSDPIESAFARHERIGFQFSGGRDSTAALYLLRPYWDRMTVYHLDTGDQFPETRSVVARVALEVPITTIYSDVEAYRTSQGVPSDLVPVDNSREGRLVSGATVKIVSRYECCYQNLMRPLHSRMLRDDITLLVRGQRDDEYATQPMRSGDVERGLEALYPIQSWTGEQVSEYLHTNDLPLAAFYERGARRAPECMGCTAWWDEGRVAYLKTYHPVKFVEYKKRMSVVQGAIDRQYAMLEN